MSVEGSDIESNSTAENNDFATNSEFFAALTPAPPALLRHDIPREIPFKASKIAKVSIFRNKNMQLYIETVVAIIGIDGFVMSWSN